MEGWGGRGGEECGKEAQMRGGQGGAQNARRGGFHVGDFEGVCGL